MSQFEIVPATLAHVRVMARIMRAAEVREARECGFEPRHLIHERYRMSGLKRAALLDGELVAIWGLQSAMLGFDAEGWLFTAPAIERAPVAFFREARRQLAAFLQLRSPIRSSIGAFHGQSLRFWRLLGADVAPAAPVWPTGKRFHPIVLRRPSTNPPFIVFGLARCRTAWLARFLSYGDVTCCHEAAVTLRGIADMRTFFRPGMGTVETAAGFGWRIIQHHVPDIRMVVVRRPVAEVVAAMLAVDVGGAATYDRERLTAVMTRGARILDEISQQPGVLTVDFAALTQREICASVFRHCLGADMPDGWWERWEGQNIQMDVRALLAYYHQHRADIDGFKRACWAELRRLAYAGAVGRRAA